MSYNALVTIVIGRYNDDHFDEKLIVAVDADTIHPDFKKMLIQMGYDQNERNDKRMTQYNNKKYLYNEQN